MSVEKRIQYLIAAARRADHEGDERTARTLLRMAEDARQELRRPERRDPARAPIPTGMVPVA